MSVTPVHDVVIAGAGPVGLMLACELRLGGASVLMLEQAPSPESALKGMPFGLRGLSIPTLEAFDRRGLLDAIRASQPRQGDGPEGKPGLAAHWMNQPRRPAGHFAGIQFFHDRVDTTKWPLRLPGPASETIATTMAAVEAVLTQRALASGVEIRRGSGVRGVDAADDHVGIRTDDDAFVARWLVGCDGGRSSVRKLAGFEFVGTEPEFTGYSVEVELAEPHELAAGRRYTPAGVYTFQPPSTLAMVDFDGGAAHRQQPLTAAHVQSVLRRVSGADASVTALRLAATWTDRAFQTREYRKGRVLLAGDAAHIHSPLGGQGLNLGLGDALNLGWKLAATLRGEAPDGLLDTYAKERHPIGAQILDWSRAQVAVMRPSASSRALEAIFRELVETRDGATFFAERVWGSALRHDLGAGHPWVGSSAPDVALDDGRRLAELLRDARGVLLESGTDALRAVARRWSDRLVHVVVAGRPVGARALLVRPDGLVAWASEGEPNIDDAARAVARWFGESAARP